MLCSRLLSEYKWDMYLVLYVWWFCTHMRLHDQISWSPDRCPKRATKLGDIKGPFLSPYVTERHTSPLRHQNSIFRLWVPKVSPAGFPNFLSWTGSQYWFSEPPGYDLAIGAQLQSSQDPLFLMSVFPLPPSSVYSISPLTIAKIILHRAMSYVTNEDMVLIKLNWSQTKLKVMTMGMELIGWESRGNEEVEKEMSKCIGNSGICVYCAHIWNFQRRNCI